MTSARRMHDSHPRSAQALETDALVDCIEECFACAQSCSACADACLGEDMVKELVRCIRLNLDCADVCGATGRILSRETEPEWNLARRQLAACATACRICGEECENHAERHQHCRVCADACRRCEEACNRMMETLPAA